MKRNVRTRFFAICMAVTMLCAIQTSEVSAKGYQVPVNVEAGDIEINLGEPIVKVPENKVVDEQAVVQENMAEMQDYIASDILLADAEETDTTRKIYVGSVSGKLSKTNDYLLYPISLVAGEYLQAKLKLPMNAQIDYDLLLFDTSLSLIKTSDYVTCTSGSGTLDESIGYLPTKDEKVYLCVYSVAGGSETEVYTLEYSTMTNFYDESEPDENAKEATALSLGTTGVTISKEMNSPIDNDWYSFTVEDSPAYDKVRLSISSNSTVNGCKIEIYRNLVVSNYYGMQFLGSGNGGEVELPAGTYYLRVVSTNTISSFDVKQIPTYTMSVAPVSEVDEVIITRYWANQGSENVSYAYGPLYRVDESLTKTILIKGRAYYSDENGDRKPAINVKIDGKVVDKQWEKNNRPDKSTVYGSDITDELGFYEIKFNLNSALGGLIYDNGISDHYYDFMEVTIYPASDDTIKARGGFYYLKVSDYNP